jgi:hypothetical protein
VNRIAQELDAKLLSLDSNRAARLANMVRDAITAIDSPPPVDPMLGVKNGWPPGYFAETAGAAAGEPFERPPQRELPERDSW